MPGRYKSARCVWRSAAVGTATNQGREQRALTNRRRRPRDARLCACAITKHKWRRNHALSSRGNARPTPNLRTARFRGAGASARCDSHAPCSFGAASVRDGMQRHPLLRHCALKRCTTRNVRTNAPRAGVSRCARAAHRPAARHAPCTCNRSARFSVRSVCSSCACADAGAGASSRVCGSAGRCRSGALGADAAGGACALASGHTGDAGDAVRVAGGTDSGSAGGSEGGARGCACCSSRSRSRSA